MMVRHDSPWWAQEIKEAMKGYGLAVVIVLVGLVFIWTKAGSWLDAKAEAEKTIAIATAKLTLEAEAGKAFREKMDADHDKQATCLKQVAELLQKLLDSDVQKNARSEPMGNGSKG